MPLLCSPGGLLHTGVGTGALCEEWQRQNHILEKSAFTEAVRGKLDQRAVAEGGYLLNTKEPSGDAACALEEQPPMG